MTEKSFNEQIDEIMAWVNSMPTDKEVRNGIIEECAKLVENSRIAGKHLGSQLAEEIRSLISD